MKILVAVDQSKLGDQVLAEVEARPWPAGTSIRLVNALESIASPMLSEVAEALEKNGRRLVDRGSARLRSRGLAAEGLILQGEPKSAILEHAASWQADLIYVGAHGASALERFLLGSVSQGVLRHASCSVQVVRPSVHHDKPDKPDKPEKDKEEYAQKYRVLLAVDGSQGSVQAAKTLAQLPWPAWTEIRVLSAVDLRLGFFRAAFEIPALDPSHLAPEKEQAMLRAQGAIGTARGLLEPTGLTISDSISVLLEPPKQIIIEEALEWKANLIVLGSHGLRGIDRFLLGSTSEAVATHAPCSVLIVR